MNNLMQNPLNIRTKFCSALTKPRGIESEQQIDIPTLYIYIYIAKKLTLGAVFQPLLVVCSHQSVCFENICCRLSKPVNI